MSREHKPDGSGLDEKLEELRKDLKALEKTQDDKERRLRIRFRGTIDDPPDDGGEGVREPAKPRPRIGSGGAALVLPKGEALD